MESFEWSLPTRVVFGVGQFSRISKLMRGFGKQVFIVTSRSFLSGGARAAILNDLLAQLQSIHVETQVFGEVEANPRTQTIDKAAQLARQFKPRFILALGGGSVMDAAKAVALLCANEGIIYDYAYKGPGKDRKLFNHALPIVCVPTVAATSSETNFFSVVTEWEKKRKVTVFGGPLQPALSVIDPQLTFSVPPAQTVDGAFDMITHVMETYLSSPRESFFQDRLTEALVESVAHALPKALEIPSDAVARSTLSWCAAFALSGAFSGRNGGWPIHALEHGLSAYTDMAHGRGLALLLPRVIEFDRQVDSVAQKLEAFERKVFEKHGGSLVAFMKTVGAYTTLKQELSATTDWNTLIQNTVDHAFETKAVLVRGEAPFLDNIRPVLAQDARAILEACL